MIELVVVLGIVLAFATTYRISLYSLAVYIDPDEIAKLYPGSSSGASRFLQRLADDPQALVQVAAVYKALALAAIVIAVRWLLSGLTVIDAVPQAVLTGLGLLVAWMSFVFIVEYLPRRFTHEAVDSGFLRRLWLIKIVFYLLYPMVSLYRGIIKRYARDNLVSEEDKEDLVERAIETLAEQAGLGERLVEDDEKEMIGQIFLLDQTVVREIMVPRPDMTAIDKSMTFSAIRALVERDGHSRYPVYDGAIDQVVGLVYVKDLFNKMPRRGEVFTIDSYLRKPYFVPETKIIGELLREFKSRRLHIAIAVDEFGGVSGLVTLEDIIEEIFGEIQDEHDLEEAELLPQPDGSWLVDAGMLVEELQDHLDTEYETDGDYDTVGGLIYDLVGSVPRESQVIKWHDLDLTVEKVEGQRIIQVRVRR